MSLTAHAISLELGGTRVLENIDVEYAPGRIVAILGPNGAGKSSLLRVLSGEWPASHGHATLHGRAIHDWPARDLATTLAILPQQPSLDFAFTVEEVVLLGRTPHAGGSLQDLEISRAAIACVDCTHLAERLYTRLSGGEKQRVHLARVLAQIWEPSDFGPRFLLLDEPTASFDLAHQQLMLEVLRKLSAEGVGIVVVMHDLNLAARSAHTMIMLKAGRIAAMGSPEDVMQPGTIREVFDVEATIGFHPRSGTPLAIL